MSTDPTGITLAGSGGSSIDPLHRRMSGYTAHGGHYFSVPFISKIAPNLWQGGCETGLVLPREVKYLVSLYPWERYKVTHELKGELYCRAYDSLDQQFEVFLKLADLVSTWREDDVVLVHCQAGLNRSSVLSALSILNDGKITPEAAVELLRKKRSPAALCNPSFEEFVLNQEFVPNQ